LWLNKEQLLQKRFKIIISLNSDTPETTSQQKKTLQQTIFIQDLSNNPVIYSFMTRPDNIRRN